MGSPDPWQVLGLVPGSPVEEARTARRRLAKDLHPDLHGARSASERAERAARMAMVNWALDQIEVDGGAWPAVGDPDSFSVERLPAEAFEALFVAAYGLGDILVVDEPYLLEMFLDDPACFCRLSLAPEAGGSLVTVDVSPADAGPPPDPTTVVAVLTAELNSLLQP